MIKKDKANVDSLSFVFVLAVGVGMQLKIEIRSVVKLCQNYKFIKKKYYASIHHCFTKMEDINRNSILFSKCQIV